MTDETTSVDAGASAPPPNPATLRKRVWWAVSGVVALWAVIYLTVSIVYVLGDPSAASDAPGAASEPPEPGGQGGRTQGPGPGSGN